jgi:hypothetical protein
MTKIRNPGRHTLGDAPIEPEYIEKMKSIAQALDQLLNGEAKGKNKKVGFVLMLFPFGDDTGRCNYISNGADRGDVVTLMKEQIRRFEGSPEVIGHA